LSPPTLDGKGNRKEILEIIKQMTLLWRTKQLFVLSGAALIHGVFLYEQYVDAVL